MGCVLWPRRNSVELTPFQVQVRTLKLGTSDIAFTFLGHIVASFFCYKDWEMETEFRWNTLPCHGDRAKEQVHDQTYQNDYNIGKTHFWRLQLIEMRTFGFSMTICSKCVKLSDSLWLECASSILPLIKCNTEGKKIIPRSSGWLTDRKVRDKISSKFPYSTTKFHFAKV